jgi:PAS domain S-box-containing protein
VLNTPESKPEHVFYECNKTQETLKNVRENLQDILNAMDDGITLVGLDGRVLDCNEASLKKLGLTREEFMGKNVYDIVVPEDRQRALEGALKVLETGRNLNEVGVLRKDNSAFCAEISVTALYDENKKPIRFLGVVRDISERKKTEEILKRQAALLDLSPDAIMVISLDGIISYWAKGAERLYGYSKQEALGKTWHDLLKTEFPMPVTEIKKQMKSTGQWSGELHHKTKSGRELIVQSRWLVEKFASESISVLESNIDITEHRKAEEMLSTQAKKTNDILEGIGDGFFALDSNLNFTYANKLIAKIYGFEPKNLIGRNLWEFFPVERGSIFEKNYREVLRTKVPKRFDYKSRIVKGWFEYNVFPTADGILIFVRDITDRKELQEKLEVYANNLEKIVEERTKKLKDSERLAAIGATASMVGHDIRNPLQAMISDVYLLKSDLSMMPGGKMKDSVKESFDDIENNILYVSKIVADLLDYAKPLNPELAAINFSDLLISVFERINIPDNIELSINVKELPNFKTDVTFIQRVLTNLVNNSVQAMQDGGKLGVAGFVKEGKIYITVSDNGAGIPDEVKSKLFSPLMTTKAKGQGLGLAVVKRLVEALNGKISFESQVGKGTKFIIELPQVQ